jgi:hypothetical protein
MLRVATVLIAMGIISAAGAAEPKELINARRHFEALKNPTEADRVRYISRLVRLRESFTRRDADMMLAIDKEVIRHPMPMPSDPYEIVKRVVGKWTSPRHQYLYRPDGGWTMLPELIDGEKATHGIWHIEGNQFVQGTSEADAPRETIILLDSTDFVWSTRVAPYYMRRGDVFPWRE